MPVLKTTSPDIDRGEPKEIPWCQRETSNRLRGVSNLNFFAILKDELRSRIGIGKVICDEVRMGGGKGGGGGGGRERGK
jgi:hypothetical protein